MINKKTKYQDNKFFYGRTYSVFKYGSLITFPLHWHHNVEIIYPRKDGLKCEVNHELIRLNKGDILFIWPGELHEIIYQPQPNDTILLQFDSQLLLNRSDFQQMDYKFYNKRIVRESQETSYLKSLQYKIEEIFDISSNETVLPEMKSCILIYQFMIILGEELRKEEFKITYENCKSDVQHQMLEICNYLSKNCTERISLDQAASKAGFSKYYFSKLFKQYTGESFTDFQSRQKLRIAEILLKDFNKTIIEISLDSGFNSISSFNRIFKKFKKVSPTQFRNMYLEREKK